MDMGAPVVWGSARTAGVNTIFIRGSRNLTGDDFRLKFLKETTSVTYLNAEHPSPFFKIKLLRKIYQKFSGVDSNFIHRMDTDHFDFGKLPLVDGPTVFVLFYLCTPENEQLEYTFVYAAHHYARSQGYGVVLLPHGGATVKGVYLKEDCVETDLPDAALMNTVENGFTFRVPPSITHLAGFPRYSLEWSEQLNAILPRRSMPDPKGKFVVTFMLSKPSHDGSTQDQILDAILQAVSIPGVFVMVKPHTGNMNISFLRRFLRKHGKGVDNIHVVSKDIQSRQLIENSGVVLWTVSTVALDAVLLETPLLRLSFMAKLEQDYAPVPLKSVEVPTIETFTERLTELATMSKPMTYSPEERQVILDHCCYKGWDTGQISRIVETISQYAR